MQRPLIQTSIVCAVLAISAATYAGISNQLPVEIFTDSNGSQGARGSLLGTRNSSDNVAFIGCNTNAFDDGTSEVFCQARDANGTFLFCAAEAPSMIQIAAAINPASYVRFTVSDDHFTCSELVVSHGSFNL
jgi:hypothetical protein